MCRERQIRILHVCWKTIRPSHVTSSEFWHLSFETYSTAVVVPGFIKSTNRMPFFLPQKIIMFNQTDWIFWIFLLFELEWLCYKHCYLYSLLTYAIHVSLPVSLLYAKIINFPVFHSDPKMPVQIPLYDFCRYH